VEYVYFQNSFFLSMVVFAAWQGVSREWVFLDCPLWLILLLMIVSLAIMLHSALRVMPLYALIQPIGSHCPGNVLKVAMKQQAKAQQTKADVARAQKGRAGSNTAKSMAAHSAAQAKFKGVGSLDGGVVHSLAGDLCTTPRKVADYWLATHVTASPDHFIPWKEQVITETTPPRKKRSMDCSSYGAKRY
jgi:hypothetical protein